MTNTVKTVYNIKVCVLFSATGSGVMWDLQGPPGGDGTMDE